MASTASNLLISNRPPPFPPPLDKSGNKYNDARSSPIFLRHVIFKIP